MIAKVHSPNNKLCAVHTSHFILFSAHCTLYNVTLHTTNCKTPAAPGTLHTAQFKCMFCLLLASWNSGCPGWGALHSAHYTLYIAQCTLNTIQCISCTLPSAYVMVYMYITVPFEDNIKQRADNIYCLGSTSGIQFPLRFLFE